MIVKDKNSHYKEFCKSFLWANGVQRLEDFINLFDGIKNTEGEADGAGRVGADGLVGDRGAVDAESCHDFSFFIQAFG